VDVEATCDDKGAVPKREMEIIEIGAVIVHLGSVAAVSQYQTFVRPVRHRLLTPFCQSLTHIRQPDVSAAPLFPIAIASFKAWMFQFSGIAWASWGDFDRLQFEQDCAFHHVPYPLPGTHANLKAMFSARQGLKKKLGMADALRHAGLQLEGTHHRGLDDARNIARLVPHCL
jgi:inhibitor of KinA sporulation pathway (predicted exonuclease)